jgi:hypothetical protein
LYSADQILYAYRVGVVVRQTTAIQICPGSKMHNKLRLVILDNCSQSRGVPYISFAKKPIMFCVLRSKYIEAQYLPPILKKGFDKICTDKAGPAGYKNTRHSTSFNVDC